MRIAFLALLLVACGGSAAATGIGVGAVGAIAAAPFVSRAQGNCYAQCIAGTECDRATGLCVPLRAPEIRAAAAAPTEAAPATALAFSDEGYGFECVTASGMADEVFAETFEGADRVCTELAGEACSCRRGRVP